jgi:hypothetical protein
MALTKCEVQGDVIGSLATRAEERGLTPQEFKDKFDEMPEGIKQYINEVLTEEIDAHLADMATQLALKVNKSDIHDMRIKGFRLNALSNVTVTFSESGFFLILTNRSNTETRGIYFADTYITTVDRWVINTVSAASDITITTGANTLNFANSSATYYANIVIVSFTGSIMT